MFENIDFNRFFSSLQYMWKGMLCIFVVIAVIIGVIYLLNYFSTRATRRIKKDDN